MAGCDYAMHLDMNPYHTGFLFTAIDDLPARSTALSFSRPAMSIPTDRYIQYSPKDFFYVMVHDPTPPGVDGGTPWEPDGGSQPPPHWMPGVWSAHADVPQGSVELLDVEPGRATWRVRAGRERVARGHAAARAHRRRRAARPPRGRRGHRAREAPPRHRDRRPPGGPRPRRRRVRRAPRRRATATSRWCARPTPRPRSSTMPISSSCPSSSGTAPRSLRPPADVVPARGHRHDARRPRRFRARHLRERCTPRRGPDARRLHARPRARPRDPCDGVPRSCGRAPARRTVATTRRSSSPSLRRYARAASGSIRRPSSLRNTEVPPTNVRVLPARGRKCLPRMSACYLHADGALGRSTDLPGSSGSESEWGSSGTRRRGRRVLLRHVARALVRGDPGLVVPGRLARVRPVDPVRLRVAHVEVHERAVRVVPAPRRCAACGRSRAVPRSGPRGRGNRVPCRGCGSSAACTAWACRRGSRSRSRAACPRSGSRRCPRERRGADRPGASRSPAASSARKP